MPDTIVVGPGSGGDSIVVSNDTVTVITVGIQGPPGADGTNGSGGSGAVSSVAGRTGAVVLSKSDVGLSSVDNTSDISKPVSTLQAASIAAKEPTITAGTTSQYFRGDKTFQTLDKTSVGLGSVDNTADASKPISTATQSALNAKASTSSLAPVATSGIYADLTGKPTIPSSLPPTGAAGGDLIGSYPNPTVIAATMTTKGKVYLTQFDPRDYGAVGDGITDDFAAFQATINAAQTNGGKIIIPAPFNMLVSSIPTVTGSNVLIEGYSWASQITVASAALNAAGTTIGIWLNGASNVIIKNLRIDGNFANIAKNGTYATAAPLWTSTVSKYGAASVKNYQYGSTGVDASTYLTYRMPIRITNSTDVLVEGCNISNSISAGILIDGTSVNATQNVMVRNNRIQMTWDNGIYFHKGFQYVSAIGNHCSDTQYAGVTAIYGNDVVIANNIVHNAGPSASDSAGIEVCGVANYVITDNELYNNLFEGIEIKDTNETAITGGLANNYARNRDGVISGNNIHDNHDPRFPSNTSAGINVFGADNTQVVGNMVLRNDYGISVASKNSDVFVQGNTIRSNASWGIQVGAIDNFNVNILGGNIIENNSGNGITSFAPVTLKDNVIRNNAGEGWDIAAKPSGMPYKTDYAENNVFADNLYNGIHAEGGTNSLVVIRNNEFINSDSLTFYDGVSNATTTFVSASANFAATDKGSTVVVLNSGDSAGSISITATIISVTNATTVVLSTALLSTLSNLTFEIFRGRQVFTDGAMSGTTALTSATANFTSADIGKTVLIYSSDGPNPSLLGTYSISSYISPTVIQINSSPGTFTGRMFVIKRGLGKQGRAVYNENSSDIHYIKNRSWMMSTENWPAYNATNNSQYLDNWDFGSGTSNGNFMVSFTMPVASVNYNRYLGGKDGVSIMDASSGALSVYLPDVGTIPMGSIYEVTKSDSSANVVTVYPSGSATINGSASAAIPLPNMSLTFITNGTNYRII